MTMVNDRQTMVNGIKLWMRDSGEWQTAGS